MWLEMVKSIDLNWSYCHTSSGKPINNAIRLCISQRKKRLGALHASREITSCAFNAFVVCVLSFLSLDPNEIAAKPGRFCEKINDSQINCFSLLIIISFDEWVMSGTVSLFFLAECVPYVICCHCCCIQYWSHVKNVISSVCSLYSCNKRKAIESTTQLTSFYGELQVAYSIWKFHMKTNEESKILKKIIPSTQ